MMLTLALTFIALAIAGCTALAIFWPLSKVHLRDRHPNWKADLGKGNQWTWFLFGRYAQLKDNNLNGLARPAQVALWTIITGLGGAWVLWLLSEYFFK
ncbi:hypothetical protein V3390_07265 [Luteimonas sp. FXH3W]|uniref:Small integral membrane protein n=1 Tax=Aquilutibacter rugosus TaxID=3115820 RepID=A0ABU7V0J9_9GAMM